MPALVHRKEDQVFEAYNGKEAVEIYKEEIHLVLMDIMMPEMNGLSAMMKIRETSSVPLYAAWRRQC